MYEYTKRDLLNYPESYQMSPFIGKKFLHFYKQARKSIMQSIKKRRFTPYSFDEILSTLKLQNSFILKKNMKRIKTEDFLIKILRKIVKSSISKNDNYLLDRMIKKFEVKKKISIYFDNHLKELSTNYSNIRNYILLSEICLQQYTKTSNLRYLNVSLKLNDTISSQIKRDFDKLNYSLFLLILKTEIQKILELCKLKQVGKF